MAELTDLTNATDGDNGTGSFDVLYQAMQRHLQEQYDAGRITGTDYATVYLGALQTTMSQSIQFLLIKEQAKSERKNSEDGGVIDLQKQKLQEEIDLVIAQTANVYEQVQASQQDTVRKNQLNQKMVLKTDSEKTLVDSQNAEQQADTTRKDAMNAEQVIKTQEEVDLLQSRDLEQLAATIRSDNESTQKILLMQAQTLGFSSDTKQKVLKLMNETYAAALAISGTGTVPNASIATQIDNVTQEILTDVGSSVNIP